MVTLLAACQSGISDHSSTSEFENKHQDGNLLNAEKTALNRIPVDGHGDFANSTFRVPDIDELSIGDAIKDAVRKHREQLNLRFLVSYERQVSKEDLKPLLTPDAVEHLHDLSLSGLKLSDEDIQPIRNLHLRTLDLDSNHVRTLQAVAHMTSLTKLTVNHCDIDKRGMAVISGLHDLKILLMHGNSITDSDLPMLYGLRKLAIVDLRDCPHLTPAAIQKLRQVLPPKCAFQPRVSD